MITAKDAVKKSLEYLIEVLGDIDSPTNISLEGIRKSDNDGWVINVSYDKGGTAQPSSLDVLLGKTTRQYKEIRLDANGNGISLETARPASI